MPLMMLMWLAFISDSSLSVQGAQEKPETERGALAYPARRKDTCASLPRKWTQGDIGVPRAEACAAAF